MEDKRVEGVQSRELPKDRKMNFSAVWKEEGIQVAINTEVMVKR